MPGDNGVYDRCDGSRYFGTRNYGGNTAVIPPSHQRLGATAVLIRRKPQWHRHDRLDSAVVPSLIAVALRKLSKPRTFALARRKLEHVQNFRSPTAGWANPHWGRRASGVTGYKTTRRSRKIDWRPYGDPVAVLLW